MPDVGLYIGSRHDIIPLLLFPEIKRWIYMDSLPVYKAGFKEDKYPKSLKKEMYLADAENEMEKAGFKLSVRNDDEKCLLFKNEKRDSEVYFFHSTFFPKCSLKQRKLMKDVNYIYLSAYCPDRIVLNMICKTKPLTLLIWHVPLFYNWRKGNDIIDFENDTNLTTFLMFNYVENVNYIYLNDKNTNNANSLREQIMNNTKINVDAVEKIPCNNLLDYHQKESQTYAEQPHYFKTLNDIPLLNSSKQNKNKNISVFKKRKWFIRTIKLKRKKYNKKL
uniref:Uncharacterized protein n=1 Tax=viral metagenome TaxID=1070528 RepID=A0A6C0JNY6_9ZZZZ